MRLLPPALLLAITSTTSALDFPPLQPFLKAISLPITLEDYFPPRLPVKDGGSRPDHDILKRQFSNTCPDDFDSCANLGAPGLCCASAAVCSADFAGNVACCPTGVECSGTINGVITAGTVNTIGSLIGGGAASATSFRPAGSTTGSTTVQGLIPAITQSTAGISATGNGFVVNSGSTVATPGAGLRRAEVPLMARAIMKALEYLPM